RAFGVVADRRDGGPHDVRDERSDDSPITSEIRAGIRARRSRTAFGREQRATVSARLDAEVAGDLSEARFGERRVVGPLDGFPFNAALPEIAENTERELCVGDFAGDAHTT